MPCEITIFLTGESTLCPHPAIATCSACHANLCSAHIIDCETCEHFLCGDCIVEHRRNHDQAEQKLKARA